MDRTLDEFERAAKQRLDEFLDPTLKKRRPNIRTAKPLKGYTVILAVREKQLATDYTFTHHSDSISRLQAIIEAEQAAKAAGWPIIGYVVDVAINQ